jgi:protein-L-isoaspartate(D-aspartate) O-methyltransferase
MEDAKAQRQRMVEEQIAARGVRAPSVLEAMRRVPREAFVPDHLKEIAYADSALPIGKGQTISQPYIVAFMAEALELDGEERVLEVGTGSGYAAAVLAEMAAEVYSLERLAEMARTTAQRLAALGYDNIHVIHADGTRGWSEAAPYGAIVVTAGGPRVPRSLREQLAIGGRLVAPVGSSPRFQELIRIRRVSSRDYREEFLGEVRFVPLIGAEGWNGETPEVPSLSPNS